jgi:hypothetical protein
MNIIHKQYVKLHYVDHVNELFLLPLSSGFENEKYRITQLFNYSQP